MELDRSALKRIGRRKVAVDLPAGTRRALKRLERLAIDGVPRKKGVLALFGGVSGSGKASAVADLARDLGRTVYRVDFSKLVSEYIGETEKNVSAVFDKAEKLGWVLFFDEADALFGKRTQVLGTHDRFANQEVSYLMKRVASYGGLVVFGSDGAVPLKQEFLKRCDLVVAF